MSKQVKLEEAVLCDPREATASTTPHSLVVIERSWALSQAGISWSSFTG